MNAKGRFKRFNGLYSIIFVFFLPFKANCIGTIGIIEVFKLQKKKHYFEVVCTSLMKVLFHLLRLSEIH